YRVAGADELRDMCIDENGVQREFSVPPPLVRQELIATMQADACNNAAAIARLRAEDQAAVFHADLRLYRALTGVRPRRDGRRRRNQCTSAHGIRDRQSRLRCSSACQVSARL